MKPAMSDTYWPAYGLRITTRHAALRKGAALAGPLSWKISSTTISFLRIWTSGMDETPMAARDFQTRVGRSDQSPLLLQTQGSGTDQAHGQKRLGHGRARIQRC